MYIQITTKCNMMCPHCFLSAGEDGENMSFDIFKIILKTFSKKLEKDNYYVVLGGGEPTVHPDFWKMLNYSLSYNKVWLSTNGLIKEDALVLCELAKKNILNAVLSLDKWHTEIDQEVIDNFKFLTKEHKYSWGSDWKAGVAGDLRVVRVQNLIINGGRCKDGKDICPCQQVQIEPSGIMKFCGCEDSPVVGIIGDVEGGFFEEYKNIPWYKTCHKNWKSK